MTKQEWIEQHRDALESVYNTMYRECVVEDDPEMWDALHLYEDTLVKLGILEADEEEPEEESLNTSTNWEEWAIDQKIDLLRDEQTAMAYEL